MFCAVRRVQALVFLGPNVVPWYYCQGLLFCCFSSPFLYAISHFFTNFEVLCLITPAPGRQPLLFIPSYACIWSILVWFLMPQRGSGILCFLCYEVSFSPFPTCQPSAFGELQYSVGDFDSVKNICDLQLAKKVLRASFPSINMHCFMGAFL